MVLVTKIISIFFDIIWLLTIVIIESTLEPWILAIIIIRTEFSNLFWKFGSNCAYIAQRELLFNYHLDQHLCFDSDFTALSWPNYYRWQLKAFWDTVNLIIRWHVIWSEVLGCVARIYHLSVIIEIWTRKEGTLFGPSNLYEKSSNLRCRRLIWPD